jgi:hypothetical protein
VTISQVDIDSSGDGYVYVSYNDCSNEPIVIPYSAAGEYVNDICVLNTSTPTQYYVFDGLNNLTANTPVNSLECCVSVTPTPTPEPTPTPTPYNAYVIQTGNTTCQGGICNINGGLGYTNLYMAPGDTFVDSTNVFSDYGLTTPFPNTNAINPGGSYPNLYYVVGGVLYIDCIKGSGC